MTNLTVSKGDRIIVGRMTLIIQNLQTDSIVVSCGSKTRAIAKGGVYQIRSTKLKLSEARGTSATLRVKHNKGGTQTVEHIKKKHG